MLGDHPLVVGNRVEVFDEDRGLAGDKGTVTDVGEHVRVKLDAGAEIDVRREQCRFIKTNSREKPAA
jgi:hypothetical protein